MDNQAENNTPGENTGKLPQFSVGTTLREAREQLGLSVADVANRIKFAPRQIEAMEADDFAHLPEMTFVRGFVRSYARLLEMDSAPLLAALPQKHVPLSLVAERKSVEVPFSSMLNARRTNIVWFTAAFLIAIVLVLFSRMHDGSSTPVQPAAQTTIETLELPLAAASAPVADVSPAEAVVASAEVTSPKAMESVRLPVVTSSPKTPTTQVQQMPAVKDNVVVGKSAKEKAVQEKLATEKSDKKQVAIVPAAATQKAANATSGLASMRLVFDEDSWVDVKDANGKILLSRMNHAGSLVRLSGVAPLSVVIGHASGVQLYFEGKKVDLAPYTSVEVARLVLE